MSQQSINVNIPSIQNKKPVAFRQNMNPPAMQGIDAETVRQSAIDTADNNYLSNRVKASKDSNPFAVLGLGIGVWYAIAQGMERFNKKFRGDYDKSLAGKISGFGDKISDTAPGKLIGSVLDWSSRQLDKLEKKSRIVYTLRHHSTSPEWSFAKMPWKGLEGFLSTDTEQVIENFMKPIEGNAQKLEFAIGDKAAKQFGDRIKNLSPEGQKMLIQRKELELLGADKKIIRNITKKEGLIGLQNYAKTLKAKAFGFKGYKEFENFLKTEKLVDNPDKALKMLNKVATEHPDWQASIWRNKTSYTNNWFWKGVKKAVSFVFGEKAGESFVRFINKAGTHLFGRNVGFSEYRNKYLVATGKGAKSRLGNALAKSVGWILEGGTNRFSGGKLAVAMQAGIFADMLYHTIKAPKNEKLKTFAERCVNDFSYFIAMTLGIIGVHKIGGFKYAGLRGKTTAMTQKQLDNYKKALKNFNEMADAGKFATKKEYKKALKQLNKKLGVDNIKNPITKLLHKIGKFINIGNERVHSYKSHAKFNINWLRKIANGNLIGVPMRILIPMAIITPVIVKFTTTTAHKIFGRPTHSVLDEEETEEPTKQSNAVQTAQQRAATQNQVPSIQANSNDTNLIRKAVKSANTPSFMGNNNQQIPQPYVNYPDTNYIKQTLKGDYPPNSRTANNVQSGKELEPKRTYIPSPENKVKNTVDMTPAEKALADADNAERFINDTLNQIK